jgi:hypothetical protein
MEATAQQMVSQQQLEIAKLAQSTLMHQKEHEIAQRAIEDAKLREQQLMAYNEASEQQQQGQKDTLFNEVLAERGRLEAHCQQLATKLYCSEYQAAMMHKGASNQNQELQDQQRRNSMLYGENASMARLNIEQEARIAECNKELGACRSEEEACQQESRRLRNEIDVAEAHTVMWQDSSHENQECLVEAWAEIELLTKQWDNAEEGEKKTTFSFSTPSPEHETGHRRSEGATEADDRPARKIKEADKVDVPALPTILIVGA